MGEWSKKIGEKGEAIVGEFLNLIGWGNAQNNIEMNCIKGRNHGSSQKLRRTHGIDHFIPYSSQLIARTLDNVVISEKETKSVLGKVTASLVKSFKDNDYVAQNCKLEKMIFSCFTNVNRFEFVFSITKSLDSSYLEFIDIVDAKFSLDETQDLPENIDWMQKNIKSYNLSGNKLHRTLFLKKANHSFIHLYNIDSKFKFNLKFNEKEISGECIISVGFPSYEVGKDNTNAEIEINVKSLSFENHSKGCNKFEIKKMLLKEIENQKIINFDKYKISQDEPVAVVARV